jgi:hypothetical protein
VNEIEKVPDDLEDLRKLLDATDKENPSPQALHALRKYLSAHPDACRGVGDLALQARQRIIEYGLPNSAGVLMSLKIHMENMSDDLGYETGSAMEKMLIENILLCWLQFHICELRFEMNGRTSQTLAQGMYWEQKLSQNQRRYLKALESLARVRRLQKEPRSPAFNVLLRQQLNSR